LPSGGVSVAVGTRSAAAASAAGVNFKCVAVGVLGAAVAEDLTIHLYRAMLTLFLCWEGRTDIKDSVIQASAACHGA